MEPGIREAQLQRPAQGAGKVVRHFRQILLWPNQLIPLAEGSQIQNHSELLAEPGPENPWRELLDEFGDPAEFQERHYSEFVAFLPHVQRFLYGEGLGKRVGKGYGDSPIKVYRRYDVAAVRMTFDAERAPVRFEVAHADLYFFYDSDVVILALEIYADELPFDIAQEALLRFGRAYPAAWDERGRARHCVLRAEWLGADGSVLAVSDYERREKYLSLACRHRAPAIASHWAFLLQPLVLHHTDAKGVIRFRQIEHYRMPYLAYFAMDDMDTLTRADLVRMTFGTGPGDADALPYAAAYLEDFESRYCYDRYREEKLKHDWPATRLMCSGLAFVMVGNHAESWFIDKERGLLGHFRHQYFILGLIALFHKAALLMLSDRLEVAVSRLDIGDIESIRAFRRAIRQTFEVFLRFSHRYWFHEVSDQAQMRELFALWRRHLGTEDLYREVRERLQDMSQYLDSDLLRRHANTIVRLTVVTILGLIGTVTTGFLGMNLIAEADAPLLTKLAYFAAVFIPTIALTLYTVMKSRRLSEFLDSLSDERLSTRHRARALLAVWRLGGRRN